MKKGIRIILALMLVLSIGLNAYGQASPKTTAKNSIVLASSTDPGTLSPYEALNMFTARLYVNVLEPLFYTDQNGAPIPVLAQDYKIDADQLGATVTIPKGVLFHDGSEMKASDVLYSLKLLVKGASAASYTFFDIDKTTIKNDYTINFRTKTVTSQLVTGLVALHVVSEKYMEAKGKQAGQSMIGTGPFRLEKYTSGDSITFKRFDKYWGEKPALDTIVVRFISEPSVAMIELETGGVDVCLDVMGADVVKVQKDKQSKFAVQSSMGDMNNYLGFNCSKPPFNDIRMRQAVAHAVNRDAIVEAAYQGLGKVGTSAVPKGYFGHIDVGYPEFNTGKAKALLKEAGYPNGLDINMHMDEQPFRKATTEQLINMLAAVGIKLKVEYHDFPTNTDLITKGNDYNIFLRGMGGGTGEFVGAWQILASAAQGYPGGANPTKTKGIAKAEEFDKLLTRISQTLDDAKRKALYGDAQKLIAQELWQMPIQDNPSSVLMTNKLKGTWMSGNVLHYTQAYFVK
jgi:peptide/nickel transport system substrate-binding protein